MIIVSNYSIEKLSGLFNIGFEDLCWRDKLATDLAIIKAIGLFINLGYLFTEGFLLKDLFVAILKKLFHFLVLY
jgi:hypothetical protein